MTGRHSCSDTRSCGACERAGRAHWAQRAAWHLDRDRRVKTRRMWLFVAAVVVGTGALIVLALLAVSAGSGQT